MGGNVHSVAFRVTVAAGFAVRKPYQMALASGEIAANVKICEPHDSFAGQREIAQQIALGE